MGDEVSELWGPRMIWAELDFGQVEAKHVFMKLVPSFSRRRHFIAIRSVSISSFDNRSLLLSCVFVPFLVILTIFHHGSDAPEARIGGRLCGACHHCRLICRLWRYSLRVCELVPGAELKYHADWRTRYDTGTIGGILAMKYWRALFSTGYKNPKDGLPDITASQSSMIVSLLSAGTFFGALGAAPLGDAVGRRLGLVVSTFVFTFGVILQTAATAIPLFVAGRFFAGFGVGLLSALVPLYQSETAPKWIRGAVVGSYQLAITIGLLIAAIVDNSTGKRNDTGSYRIPVAIQFAWAIILVTGMLILPETPRYHIKMGRGEKAAKALSRLRRLDVDHPALVEELSEVKANHDYEMSLGKASYLDCFKGNLGKRLMTGCLLQGLQQLTGVSSSFQTWTFSQHVANVI